MVSPTYQEAAGIEAFIERFAASRDDFGLLIVDDGSPDGTGAIVERLAGTRPWLHLLSRSGKGGLGSAYRAGFAWALERDYELIGQIDADGQHPPEALVALRPGSRPSVPTSSSARVTSSAVTPATGPRTGAR